jgi:hypothetical protein
MGFVAGRELNNSTVKTVRRHIWLAALARATIIRRVGAI